MPIYLLLIGLFLVFLLSAYYAMVSIGPLILLQPRRFTVEDYRRCTDILAPEDLHLQYENLKVQTRDGLKLDAWFVLAASPVKGTIIYLHGLSDNKIGGIPVAKLFHDHGYNTCLYDSRRHGESEGSFCTYGHYEKFDVVDVINQLERLYKKELGRIGLFGGSMGAAVALQAAAIDARIAAVVAEAAFTDLRSISLDYQKRIIKLRWKVLRDLAIGRAERMASFKVDEVSPVKALEDISVPILFVHGTNDSLIDPHYSEILYQRAKEPKEIYLIKDAYHNDTRIVGGREYEKKLLTFFDRWLGATTPTSSSSSAVEHYRMAP